MSIMGRVMLECDTKGCHGGEGIEAEDFSTAEGLTVTASFSGWVMDDDGEIHCPMCCADGRERGDDDGVEYGHPEEELRERRERE